MHIALEMKLYKKSVRLWSVLKVMEHAPDLKSLVWENLDADSKAILREFAAEDAKLGK